MVESVPDDHIEMVFRHEAGEWLWACEAHQRITWPGQLVALELSSADAPYFQVYSPVGHGFFAAEPVQKRQCRAERAAGPVTAAGHSPAGTGRKPAVAGAVHGRLV